MAYVKFHHEQRFRSDEKSEFHDLWNLSPVKTISSHRTSDVTLVALPCMQDPTETRLAYRKRYWYPGLSKKLRGFFRNTFIQQSRAKSEFENLRFLCDHGLSEIKPIGYGEDRCFRFLNRALIFTECLSNTFTFEIFLSAGTYGELTFPERKAVLIALGEWIGAFHRRGYHDHGLFARNIIIHRMKKGWSYSKIDSPKGCIGRRESNEGKPYLKDIKDLDSDLSQYLSRAERVRAFKAYLQSWNKAFPLKTMMDQILP